MPLLCFGQLSSADELYTRRVFWELELAGARGKTSMLGTSRKVAKGPDHVAAFARCILRALLPPSLPVTFRAKPVSSPWKGQAMVTRVGSYWVMLVIFLGFSLTVRPT